MPALQGQRQSAIRRQTVLSRHSPNFCSPFLDAPMTQSSQEKIEIPPLASPQRLDRFLAERFPEISRNVWMDRLADAVRVDGKIPKKGQRLRGGESILIDHARLMARLVANPQIAIHVVYQDDGLIALDKPAGLPSHGLRAEQRESLANGAAAVFPELARFTEKPLEGGLIHRLDNDTSGLLLFARHSESYRWLKALNQEGAIEKYYLALVEGIAPRRGQNARPVAHAKNPRKMVVSRDVATSRKLSARPALTEFRRVAAFAAHSLLLVKIRKGKRHQIRVHLADLGYPIVGDALYGTPNQGLAARQLLHAYKIAFSHPALKQRVKIRAKLPADFQRALKTLAS